MNRCTKTFRGACTSIAAVATILAGADAAARQLEEILVTATKREAGMQDIPIAITALSGEELEDKNILSARGLENYTPGLRIPQQDASKTFVRIRGVGSRKFDIGSEGSVGIFVDEIYIPRFSGADIGFLDVERVEVLKGHRGLCWAGTRRRGDQRDQPAPHLRNRGLCRGRAGERGQLPVQSRGIRPGC